MDIKFILIVLAIVCFALATIGVVTRINLVAAGLMLGSVAYVLK
jgi:hypothetical protein